MFARWDTSRAYTATGEKHFANQGEVPGCTSGVAMTPVGLNEESDIAKDESSSMQGQSPCRVYRGGRIRITIWRRGRNVQQRGKLQRGNRSLSWIGAARRDAARTDPRGADGCELRR
jgi:hypothetical protein